MLVKVGEIIDLFNKIPDRYDQKVLEQIAIAGCLNTEKFLDSKEKSKEASNYVAQRINISRPDFDRGWKGEYSIENGFVFRRELRGVEDIINIDNDLLHSQLIENLNKNYSDILQLFESPGSLINKEGDQIEIYSPSQLLDTINAKFIKGSFFSLSSNDSIFEPLPEIITQTFTLFKLTYHYRLNDQS